MTLEDHTAQTEARLQSGELAVGSEDSLREQLAGRRKCDSLSDEWALKLIENRPAGSWTPFQRIWVSSMITRRFTFFTPKPTHELQPA